MKIIMPFAIAAIASGFGSAQAQESEYRVSAHVSATHYAFLCSSVTNGNSFCLGPQQIIAQIGGKKFELAGGDYKHGGSLKGLLPLGDYKARIAQEEHSPSSEYRIVYEFLMPDRSTRKFAVIGESE